MISDAAMDYQSGQISVRPGGMLYLQLAAKLIIPLPKLLWRFPCPMTLAGYGISFLWEVFFAKTDES